MTPGSNSGPEVGPRRRQFLAGLAAASGVAVAGCADLPLLGDESTTFTASDADAVIADATPTVEWPAPVRPSSSALEDARDRIDDLLADVPESLGPDDVPNGVVRESIVENREEAVRARDEADRATGREKYHAFRGTRDGRETARAALTTLLAIEEDTDALVDELADEREAVQSAVRERLDGIDYRGDDTEDGRRRAALYYQQLESDLVRAQRLLERWSADPGMNVVELGEAAGELEFATATVAVWDHLADRYENDTTGADLESVFDSALERSIDRAEAVEFPEQDGEEWYDAVGLEELDDGRLELTVWHAGREVTDARERMEEGRTNGNVGTGLHGAVQFEQAFRAFEHLRDRIAAESVAPPDDVDAIRAERDRALESAVAAREQVPVADPSLGAYVLGETLQSFEWTDESVRRYATHDPEVVVSLSREYGEYARLQAELAALPDAVTAFRERLTE
ncbi:hypothetical protein [Halopiger xanaduensis]|uniref:Uncharacterized protein n=1 Tax=Halopiger xanaduensis (strain DSM 18323 / JCM 14033 / SH-6) TaxID=797210 RepID=F8D826_HALXS|nr:hypothetical protein [Halopiger xanaduensis]AEH37918.1 hypothetical protein Halxa_3306 [Halopiger xanaduensis SH-6]